MARDDDFRFLVGGGRSITVRFEGWPAILHCEVQSAGAVAVPADPSSGVMTHGEFTFTPLATTANRPLGDKALPPVVYSVTIRDDLGTVVTNAVIAQDLKDRMRQEYVDAAIWNAVVVQRGTGHRFLDGSSGLIDHAPPRDQIVLASAGDPAETGLVGNCRDFPSPNYADPATEVGLVWDQGFARLVRTLREQMAPAVVCLHSGHRSPSHNRRVGGAVNSDHLWGRAADMSYAAAFATTPAHARFNLDLYRAALRATTGQVLLENGSQQRLPNRWDPPPADHVFRLAVGDPRWSVAVEDTNADGLPDRVQRVIGEPAAAELLRWDGGDENPDLGVLDDDGDGRISPGDTLVLHYDGVNTLDERFAGATHVHAEAD